MNYEPQWAPPEAASQLIGCLIENVTWQRRTIQLFGRSVVQPRLIAWAGPIPYRYSGQTLEPKPIPNFLEALFRSLETHTLVRFNHVLMNRYRDGDDCMGWHSDDEPELGSDPPIASLSLGVTRRFLVKPKAPLRGPSHRWYLENGSLLFMGGATQHQFRHGVPRQRTVRGERVNLTFRRILREPEARTLGR